MDKGTFLWFTGVPASGKSTIGRLLFRFYDVGGGSLRIDGQDVRTVGQASLRRSIALVPQDPLSALNPSIQVGEQLAEPLRQHMGLSGGTLHQRVLELLAMVRVPDPARVKGKNVLLMDDVYTTGATADECARTLLAGGAQRVDILTLARVL